MFRLMASALLFSSLFSLPVAAQTNFSVPNFVEDVLDVGEGATAIDFAPDGTLYVTEKRGRVLSFAPDGTGGFLSRRVLLDIQSSVDSTTEAGLLGIAIDPEYATNRYLYVFYTTSNDQRVVRYTLNPAGNSASSPTILLSGLPRSTPIHKAGDIQFRPGEPGNLYVSLGDDGDPSEADSLNSYRGKMLRINKTNGEGLTTNPYHMSGSVATVRARLWSVGMRNPWRFTFHPDVGQPRGDVLYVSENGDSTDKMSWVRAGSNGGWSPAGDGPFVNVADPNHRVLYTGPASHLGIAIAARGPFTDNGTPVVYLSNWIDPSGGSIRRFRLTGTELDRASAVPADRGNPFATRRPATALRFGPDGHLYFTLSSVDESLGGFYEVGRIRYVGGTPPVASFTTNPSPAQGPVPFTVAFTDASTDSDGMIQTRSWSFGDGGTSAERNPTHTYSLPGNYTVTLTVTDDDLLTHTVTGTVRAVAAFTLTLRGEVLDGSSADGGRRTGTTQLRFYQGDGTPVVLPSGLGPDENGASIVDGNIELVVPMSLTSSHVVVTAGEAEPNIQTQTFAFAVPAGQAAHTETITLWPSSIALRGRITDTRMDPAEVDLGIALGDIASLYPVVGGRDYLSGSGFPTTRVAHRVVSDALGYYYFPLRDAGTYFLDVVGDTGASTYLATLTQTVVQDGSAVDLDLTLGLQSGGAGCDDLSEIAATANVDYSRQIQPLWGVCIGCHRANSANGGGLDLTSGSSWAELVGVSSTQVPGRLLVDPGDPASSYLMEKISCANPQVGNRMRPDSSMSPGDQALVRDWIAQGALQSAGMAPMDAGVPDGPSGGDAGVPDGSDGGDAGVPDGSDGGDAGVADSTPGTGAQESEGSGGCRCAASARRLGRADLGGLLLGFGIAWAAGRRRHPFSSGR